MAFVPTDQPRRAPNPRPAARTVTGGKLRANRTARRRKRMIKDIRRLSRLRSIDIPSDAQIVSSREDGKRRQRVVITFSPSGRQLTYYPSVSEQTQAVAAGTVDFHASDWGEAPPLLHQWSDAELHEWLMSNPKRSRVRRRRRKGDYYDSLRP